MKEITTFNVRFTLFSEPSLSYDKYVIIELMTLLLKHGDEVVYDIYEKGLYTLTPTHNNTRFSVKVVSNG